MALEQAGSVADNETIARRAYELFASRGYEHGHDMADWLSAEAEVRRKARARNAGARKSSGTNGSRAASRTRRSPRK